MRWCIIVVLMVCWVSAWGQDKTPAYKRNYVDETNNAVEKAREKMESTVDNLFTSSGNEDGTVKIKGQYYMHLYTTNLYTQSDGESMRQECTRIFSSQFPMYAIISCALPQTNWYEEDIKKGSTTVGTTRYMCCYILAKNTAGEYINARFIYKDYKPLGGTYARLRDYAPKADRADHLTQAVYDKLLTK